MWDGSIHTDLNEKDLSNIVKIIKEQNIKAVAVCYLHSYVNPQHEIQTREFLAQNIEDDVVISLSPLLGQFDPFIKFKCNLSCFESVPFIVTVRWSNGTDINAGCGQLAVKDLHD